MHESLDNAHTNVTSMQGGEAMGAHNSSGNHVLIVPESMDDINAIQV